MNMRSLFRFEESALFLVLSNVFTIAVAVVEQWNLSDVMWIYWGQSVVIGFFNWRRMLRLRQFSTANFTINDRPVSPTRSTQRQVAFFFLLHYGFFHAVYLVFLLAEKGDLSRLDVAGIGVCVAVFAANHGFSFRHNLDRDLGRTPNIGTLMFTPYARIIPMHLTILSGSLWAKQSQWVLVLFLILKTLADLVMHLVEHWEDGPPSSETASRPPSRNAHPNRKRAS